MVVYEFDVEDVARIRLAISPMLEVVHSLRALVDPSRAAVHLPWLEGLRGRLHGLDLAAAIPLVPATGYIPDFLAPPPASPLADFDAELDAVRATPADQIRRELAIAFRGRRRPAAVQPLIENPRRELPRLCDTLAEYWSRAIEPHWPRLRALLRADVLHRAARLAEGGADALFRDVHGRVSWHGDSLRIDQRHEEVVALGGRGLLLVPSAFFWQVPSTITLPPWQPALVYPVRGVATLWERGATSPDALAALLGATRAALLADLDAPRSTTELARRAGVSAGGASQHLTVLRAGGLVAATRAGRSVLYVRTPLADALVRGG